MPLEKCALTSPEMAEYSIESPAGVSAEQFFELIRFVSVHITQHKTTDSMANRNCSIERLVFIKLKRE